MFELGLVGPALRVHQRALKLLRSMMGSRDDYGFWAASAVGVAVKAHETKLIVIMDDLVVYQWELVYGKVDITYDPHKLERTLELLDKVLVLEDLADV